jgi:hypothetical protein
VTRKLSRGISGSQRRVATFTLEARQTVNLFTSFPKRSYAHIGDDIGFTHCVAEV